MTSDAPTNAGKAVMSKLHVHVARVTQTIRASDWLKKEHFAIT